MKSSTIDNFTCPTCGEVNALIIDEESGYFCNGCKALVSRTTIQKLMYELNNERQAAFIEEIMIHRDHLVGLVARILPSIDHLQDLLRDEYGITPEEVKDYIERGGDW